MYLSCFYKNRFVSLYGFLAKTNFILVEVKNLVAQQFE